MVNIKGKGQTIEAYCVCVCVQHKGKDDPHSLLTYMEIVSLANLLNEHQFKLMAFALT